MRRRVPLLLLAIGFLGGLAGCRCCCLLDPYATKIDHIKDYPILFDQWYCPRLDISRAGKPDWCGPINRHLGCCRCECQPEWTRYDEVWLYPPRYPYEFPNHSFPGPTQSEPAEKPLELEVPESAPLEPDLDPKPLDAAPLPEPPPE